MCVWPKKQPSTYLIKTRFQKLVTTTTGAQPTYPLRCQLTDVCAPCRPNHLAGRRHHRNRRRRLWRSLSSSDSVGTTSSSSCRDWRAVNRVAKRQVHQGVNYLVGQVVRDDFVAPANWKIRTRMILEWCDNINRSRCCDNQIDHLRSSYFVVWESPLTGVRPGDDEVVGEFSLFNMDAINALPEGDGAGLSKSVCKWVTMASKRSFSIFNWSRHI